MEPTLHPRSSRNGGISMVGEPLTVILKESSDGLGVLRPIHSPKLRASVVLSTKSFGSLHFVSRPRDERRTDELLGDLPAPHRPNVPCTDVYLYGRARNDPRKRMSRGPLLVSNSPPPTSVVVSRRWPRWLLPWLVLSGLVVAYSLYIVAVFQDLTAFLVAVLIVVLLYVIFRYSGGLLSSR
jgi:hypothetical protein